WQTGGRQLDDFPRVSQKSRRMASVEITHGTQVFVVATGKCGSGADVISGFNDGAVQLQTELHHGIGLIHVFGREQPAHHGAKDVLHRGNYGTVLLDSSGHVEESEKDSRWADAHELITVAADAMIVIARRELGILKLRNF